MNYSVVIHLMILYVKLGNGNPILAPVDFVKTSCPMLDL